MKRYLLIQMQYSYVIGCDLRKLSAKILLLLPKISLKLRNALTMLQVRLPSSKCIITGNYIPDIKVALGERISLLQYARYPCPGMTM
jgi:hypothetical protein